MTNEALKSWLDAYGRAWESLDPGAAADLFTEDATYQETPFVEPMRGRAAIFEYWSHVARTQEQARFSYEILSVAEDIAIAHWWASLVRLPSKTPIQLDGIFLLTFNADSRCRTLREWWVKQERKLSQS